MPSTNLRQTVLRQARRIVIKLGSNVLCDNLGGIDPKLLSELATQIAKLTTQGYTITLVSSAAISAGCAELCLKSKPTDIARQQAVAAVGQRRLMTRYHEAFSPFNMPVAQLLLTRSDFDDRTRFLNIRNCIMQAHKLGAIPIINENDSVAVDEIRFGDNDLLASLVCNALPADVMILLTTVDGLLDQNNQVVDMVENIQEAKKLIRQEKSTWGTGGIQTKLESAKRITDAGEMAIIANGRTTNILTRLLQGERLGTVFLPAPKKLDSRRRWIGLTKRSAGCIIIDQGACKAISKKGTSLLASGIDRIEGDFKSGDVVSICDQQNQEIAKGLTNYPANELDAIKGKKSDQFRKILGHGSFAEVVHRNNMVVISLA